MFRGSIPDSKKREAILSFFNISPSCEIKYDKTVSMAG